jgi:hypothetical protein
VLAVLALLAEQPHAEVAERAGGQPGDVHLGDPEVPADLRLGHVFEEPHGQDLLLAHRQLAPVGGDGLHAEHVLQLRVLRAEQVGQGWRAGRGAQRCVERAGLEGQLCSARLAQRVSADSQASGEVGLGRIPAEILS